VFLHTPHQRTRLFSKSDGVGKLSLSSQEADLVKFSFGQHITALEAGQLSPELSRDLLVIGSQTNILAYDVEKNSELFYKDVSEIIKFMNSAIFRLFTLKSTVEHCFSHLMYQVILNTIVYQWTLILCSKALV